MSGRYIDILLGLRWPVLVLWGLLLISSALVYGKRFSVDNSVGIWFLENDPDLKRYRSFNEAFGGREWIIAVLQTRSIRDRSFLTRLYRTGAEIEALPDVAQTISVVMPMADPGNGASGPEKPFTLPYTNLMPPSEAAVASAAFRDLLVRPGNDRHAAMLIQTAGPALGEQADWTPAVDRIRDLLAAAPGVEEFWLAGTPIINAELNRAARRDMVVFYCVLSLLLVLFGRLFLGHTRDLLILLAVVLGSVLPPLGLVSAIGLSFNMVTIMLPTILVSMSASVAVHMINEFHLLRASMPARAALGTAVSALIRPAFWTTATTITGFLSLAQSDVNPIRQTGYLAALGIALGFLTTFVIAPLLLKQLWKTHPAQPAGGGRGKFLRGIARLSAGRRSRRAVTAGAVVVFAACLAGLPNLEADTDYVNFFKTGRQINADYRAISGAGFAQYSLELDLLLPDHLQAQSARFKAAIHGLGTDIEALPKVHRALYAADLPARLETVAAAIGTVGVDAAAHRLVPIAAVDTSARDFLRLTTEDGRRTRIVIFSEHMSSRDLDEFRQTVAGLVRRHLPTGTDAAMVGTNVLWSNMDKSVIDTQLTSIAIIFCVLLLLMPVLTGSIRIGLIGLIVSVLPVLSVLGLMGWAGLTINVATCLIGGVALGVAIDDTIFLLLRVRREQAAGGHLRHAVRESLTVSGRAMVTTSAIMTICFLSMGLSDFVPTAQFGWLFALTIGAALTADLLLLPSLMLIFGWRR